LLIDLNRSRDHRAVYSDRTRDLSQDEKARIVARYYEPYRGEVERLVRERIAAGRRVLHLSSHSFTPVLDGVTRSADVGLLYDPKRRFERMLCERWTKVLGARIAPLRVRRNYPYRGYDDGLTTFLRLRFDEADYLGVEMEINQEHAMAAGVRWRSLRAQILQSLVYVLESR
jgi:predicted N-formylglutamate amidohydrolase